MTQAGNAFSSLQVQLWCALHIQNI